MSQDLFAAFTAPEKLPYNQNNQASNATKSPGFSIFDDLLSGNDNATTAPPLSADVRVTEPVAAPDDDEWGDFEGADITAPVESQPSKPIESTIPPSRHHYSLDELGPSQKQTGANTTQNPAFDLLGFEQPVKRPKSNEVSDPNVLFDASNEPSEDDFGDFEGAVEDEPSPPKNSVAASLPEVDLLGLDDDVEYSTVQVAPKTTPTNPAISTKSKSTSTTKLSLTQEAHQEEDEPWDDFAAWDDATTQTPEIPPQKPITSESTSALNSIPGSLDSPKELDFPTTIPPPSVLLSLFPPVFSAAETELLRPLSSLSQQARQAIYTDPRTIEYLKGFIAIVTVCARVIAGRKHRWKRDRFLAKSMRIGPVAAGGKSGMKVTSIDKAELAREEREVAEVIGAWSAVVGRVKGAIAEVRKVNEGEKLGQVPELKDGVLVKSCKEIEGGVFSATPCGLCGIKREERVPKVDVDVEDSFGEWWIERINMHRACRNFWVEHEVALRQR